MAKKIQFHQCGKCNAQLPDKFRFCGFCGASLVKQNEAANETAYKNERRDVSVLFADVSGFTSMCETMDPEDVFTLMNEVFTGLGKAINDQGGHIDKYIGDNVMALFGAPIAHEDDPTRACLAALAMQKFLGEFAAGLFKKTGVMLKMRIGINCGLVLAGAIGSKVKREYSVLGDNVNLASRLESNAPPGGVLISDSVAQRIRGFTLSQPREIKVKGKADPVTAFELIGQQQLQRREENPGIFVGRDQEMKFLCSCLQKKNLFKKALLLTGETGTGKTRLINEALQQTPGLNLIWGKGQQQTVNQPYGLAGRILHDNLAQLVKNANALAKPETAKSCLLEINPELEIFAPAILHLLFPELPVPDRDPEIMRQTFSAGFKLLFDSLGRKYYPLVMVLDSFEASDEASAQIIKDISLAGEKCRIQLLVSSRSSLNPTHSFSELKLGPLARKDAKRLLHSLLEQQNIPEQTTNDFLVKAGDNPLFIEQLALWANKNSCRTKNEKLLLPPSLRAIVVSRIDRLTEPGRDLLRVCSIQGPQFHLKFAGAAMKATAAAINQIIPELIQAGLVIRSDPNDQQQCAFRQQMIQEVCYETMMMTDRRKLHLATARALQAQSAEHTGAAPELLAFHYERGEDWAKSGEAKAEAGNRALSFGLNHDACRWFAGAADDLTRVSAGSEALRIINFKVFRGLTQVKTILGATSEAVQSCEILKKHAKLCEEKVEMMRLEADLARIRGEYSAAETTFRKALELQNSCKLKDTRLLLDYADHLLKGAKHEDALQAVQSFRDTSANEPRSQIIADTLEGKIEYARGNFTEAGRLFLRAYNAAKNESGLSEKAKTANLLGNVERDLGHYVVARRYYREALQTWEIAGDVEGIAGANNNLGNLAMSLGNFRKAEQYHRETLKRWQSAGNVSGAILSQANLAILALELKNGERAIKYARQARESLGESGSIVLISLVRVIEGEGLLLVGKTEQALHEFNEVLDNFSPEKARLAHAGAIRGLGKIAMLNKNFKQANEYFIRAEEAFRAMKRTQEAARSSVLAARSYLGLKMPGKAREKLLQAEKDFAGMKAAKDLAWTRSLLKSITRN